MTQDSRPARFVLTALTLTLIVWVGGCSPNDGQRGGDPPQNLQALRSEVQNVILISIDTLRADHLACYGHEFVQSPNIDVLAEEGILFEQHINAASTTLASHTSMFTGTYPHSHGVARNKQRVGDANLMLTEVLKAAGFVTAGFIGAFPMARKANFHQGFDHYDVEFRRSVPDGARTRGQRRADAVTDAVLGWLDGKYGNRPKATDASGRMFLFIHYFDPHWPYRAPPPYARMYQTDTIDADGSMGTIKKARTWLRMGYRHPGLPSFVVGAGPDRARPPEDASSRQLWERGLGVAHALDAEYGAEITFCDHHVGKLFDGLKKRGLFENSLVILTSDHGETMHEHDNVFNHGVSVYETEIRTPLIVRFPDGTFGGRRVSRVVSNVDLMPTILELLGLPGPERMEGESFAAVVDGPLPPRAPVFAEATQPWKLPMFDEDPIWSNRGKFQCIRTERYKYMFRIPDRQYRFYDLTVDPNEQANLIGAGHGYDTTFVDELKKQLMAWRDDAHPISSQPIQSKEHIEALRALGYVGDAPDRAGDGDKKNDPPEDGSPP